MGNDLMAVGCTSTYFVKLKDVPVGFVTPASFEAAYCFIFSRRRVAVAIYRMICLGPILCITYTWQNKNVSTFGGETIWAVSDKTGP